VEGLLQDRLGEPMRAAATLRKLNVLGPIPVPVRVQTTWPVRPWSGADQGAEARLKKALEADIPWKASGGPGNCCYGPWRNKAILPKAFPSSILHPLGTGKPSNELGGHDRGALSGQGEGPGGGRAERPEVLYPARLCRPAWISLGHGVLSNLGSTKESAEAFRQLITEKPGTPEADEARLALARSLAKGTFPPRRPKPFQPHSASGRIKRTERKGNTVRQTLLVQLRLA